MTITMSSKVSTWSGDVYLLQTGDKTSSCSRRAHMTAHDQMKTEDVDELPKRLVRKYTAFFI